MVSSITEGSQQSATLTELPDGYVRLTDMVRALCSLSAEARQKEPKKSPELQPGKPGRAPGSIRQGKAKSRSAAGQRRPTKTTGYSDLLDQEAAAACQNARQRVLMWLRTGRLWVQGFDFDDEVPVGGPSVAYWRTPDGKRALITGAVPAAGGAATAIVSASQFGTLAVEFLRKCGLLDQVPGSALGSVGISLTKTVHRPPSREKPFWSSAKKIGIGWLEENGYPQKGDGNQAKLEKHIADWLSDRGHDAGETTIRRHVNDWMEEFREGIGM